MHRNQRYLIAALLVIVVSGVAFGQDSKADLYKKFTDNYNKGVAEQAVARSAAKDYLAKYGTLTAEEDRKITKYLENWAAKYDKAARRYEFLKLLAANKAPEGFAGAKAALAEFPDDLDIYAELARVGFDAIRAGNETIRPDTIAYAIRAVQMLEAGKNFAAVPITPADREDRIATLSYLIGAYTVQEKPKEALPYLRNAVSKSKVVAKEPSAYAYIVFALQKTKWEPEFATYKKLCTDSTGNTKECKDAESAVISTAKMLADGVSRALFYAEGNTSIPKAQRDSWMQTLTAALQFIGPGTNVDADGYIKATPTRPIGF